VHIFENFTQGKPSATACIYQRSRLISFYNSTNNNMGVCSGVKNGHFPPRGNWDKEPKFLENLKLAAKFRLAHSIVAMTVYLPV